MFRTLIGGLVAASLAATAGGAMAQIHGGSSNQGTGQGTGPQLGSSGRTLVQANQMVSAQAVAAKPAAPAKVNKRKKPKPGQAPASSSAPASH
jgi:hypothetical protein